MLRSETLPDGVRVNGGKLGTKRAATITRITIVRAPVESCFKLIAKQLEKIPERVKETAEALCQSLKQ